jgi:hypothetical protein
MDLILHLAESTEQEVHVIFRRPWEEALKRASQNEAYVTFYNPRRGAPAKLAPNHFRFAARTQSLYQHIVGLLKVVEHELTDHQVTVQFGWPLSSWVDRISIGVMVFNIMRLPRQFPNFRFTITYPGSMYGGRPS